VPSKWVLISSATDLALVSTLAWSGTLMAPLPWRIVAAIFLAAAGFAILLDQVKLRVMSTLGLQVRGP
jgi:H+-transporting ATPase